MEILFRFSSYISFDVLRILRHRIYLRSKKNRLQQFTAPISRHVFAQRVHTDEFTEVSANRIISFDLPRRGHVNSRRIRAF